jgi:hypothetical protein
MIDLDGLRQNANRALLEGSMRSALARQFKCTEDQAGRRLKAAATVSYRIRRINTLAR